MFSSYLTDFNVFVGSVAAAYILGVITSQKAKDFFAGMPSAARAALKASEADLLLKLKTAEDEVLAKLPGVASKIAIPAKTPLAPTPIARPVAQPVVAPTPAPAPAADAAPAPAAPTA